MDNAMELADELGAMGREMAEVFEANKLVVQTDAAGTIYNAHQDRVGIIVEPNQISLFETRVYHLDAAGRVSDGQSRLLGMIVDGKVFDTSYRPIATSNGDPNGEAGAALLALKDIERTTGGEESYLASRPPLQPPPDPVKVVTPREKDKKPDGDRPDRGRPDRGGDENPLLTCLVALFLVGFALMALVVAAIAIVLTTPVWLGSVAISLFVANTLIKRYLLGTAAPTAEWKAMRKAFAIKRHALLIGFVYSSCVAAALIAFGAKDKASIIIWCAAVGFGCLVSSRLVDIYSSWLIKKLTSKPILASSPESVNVARFMLTWSFQCATASLVILAGAIIWTSVGHTGDVNRTALTSNQGSFNSAALGGSAKIPAATDSRTYSGSPIPPTATRSGIPPLATDPGQPKVDRKRGTNDWETVKIAELGDVYIMVPPGFDRKWTFKHLSDVDHVEFHAIGANEPTIVIDVSPKGQFDDLAKHANSLRNAFTKAYKADYHEQIAHSVNGNFEWQYDLVRHGVKVTKNDFFKKMQFGRSAAILLTASPAVFERYRPYLKQLHGTLTEGYEPDPGDG